MKYSRWKTWVFITKTIIMGVFDGRGRKMVSVLLFGFQSGIVEWAPTFLGQNSSGWPLFFCFCRIWKKFWWTHLGFGLVANFFKNRLVTLVQMSTKDEKKWKFSACALGSNGGFWKIRPYGSRVKIKNHSNSRVTPLFGGFWRFLDKVEPWWKCEKKMVSSLTIFLKMMVS